MSAVDFLRMLFPILTYGKVASGSIKSNFLASFPFQTRFLVEAKSLFCRLAKVKLIDLGSSVLSLSSFATCHFGIVARKYSECFPPPGRRPPFVTFDFLLGVGATWIL